MEKQEMKNRTEAWNMAPFALAIPLSIIALAFAKAKIKIKLGTSSKGKTINKRLDNTYKPRSNDQFEARDRAMYCFGTAKLFEKRRKILKRFNKANKFLGLFIPVSLGFLYMSSKDTSLMQEYAPILIIVATFFNGVLLFISVWSLVAEWDAKIENYTESISNNTQYYKDFKEISERYDEDPTEYATKLKETILLDNIQQKKDGKENFSGKDDRFIMRYGLYQLQLKCVICDEIPNIKKPGNCSNCGK